MSVIDLDPESSSSEPGSGAPDGASVYERLRADIIAGRVPANARLKVRELATRFGVSTNPVREALQQLRGQGLVIIEPNRGARVRPVDEKFVHDIGEIESLIEPFLTHWFVGIATQADLEKLEAIQAEIEAVNFSSLEAHNALDSAFHRLIYERHPNTHLLELWWNHRDVLSAVVRGLDITLTRRSAVIREHKALIACIKAHDADGAAAIVREHVQGSSRMWIDQLRANRRFG